MLAAVVFIVGRWWNARVDAAAAEVDREPLRDSSAAVPVDNVSAAAAAKKTARIEAFQCFESLDDKLAAIGADSAARQKFREDVSNLIALSAKS